MSSVSLAFVFILSGLILFGWETAVLIAFVSAVAAQLVERRPLSRARRSTAPCTRSRRSLRRCRRSSTAATARTTPASRSCSPSGAVRRSSPSTSPSSRSRSRSTTASRCFRSFARTSRLIGPAFGIQACLAALAASLWTIDARLLVLMAGPLFTVVLYQRSSLASRIAKRDAHTDSLTLVGNNRAYELAPRLRARGGARVRAHR